MPSIGRSLSATLVGPGIDPMVVIFCEDLLAISDNLFREEQDFERHSDVISIGDHVGIIAQYQRSKGDTLTSIETLDRGLNDTLLKLRSFGDPISIGDHLDHTITHQRAKGDSVVIGDQLDLAVKYQRVEEDSVAVDDQLDLAVGYQRAEGDSVVIDDQADPIVEYQRSKSDSATLIETLDRGLNDTLLKIRSRGDSVIISDQLALAVGYQRVEDDSIIISDQADPIVEYQRAKGDSVVIGDQLDPAVKYQRVESDSVVIGDQLAPAVKYQRAKNDLIIPIDSLQVVRHLYRKISNSIIIGDAVSIIVADPYWTQLFNAAATVTPEVCWFRDSSFETVDGSGNLSAASCAWGSGHNLSQATAARRPFVNTKTWDFDRVQWEYMHADFSTPVAAGDRIFGVVWDWKTNDNSYWWFVFGSSMYYVRQNGGMTNRAWTWGWGDFLYPADEYPPTGDQYAIFRSKAPWNGTNSRIRISGAQYGNDYGGSQIALSGTGSSATLGCWTDDGSGKSSFDMRSMAIYSGTDATDEAAIEAILAAMYAEGL